jgi:serine phosphatase RsbU (regulator of sigma subunit)
MAAFLSAHQLDRLLLVRSDAPLRAPTSDAALSELFAALCDEGPLPLHEFPAGAVIFTEGEAGENMYLIQNGQVAILKGDFEAPTLLDFRSRGEIIGEMALVEDRPRSASVVALEDSRLLCVDRADFQQLLVQKPALAITIMATLSGRLRSADTQRKVMAEAEEELVQELKFAGQIQARLLPDAVPDLPGWDVAVNFRPARYTSGDFYDFIALPNGQLGLVVADVSDKGAGAALFMAVCRTLIRTFALQYPDAPELALEAANERILFDSETEQFVTVFYGALDPHTGTLIYANAGHNPGYQLRASAPPQKLSHTGIPLGLLPGMRWGLGSAQFAPGDALVLYTDGVSEARNAAGKEFGEARLVEVAQDRLSDAAEDIRAALVAAIDYFVGDAPQHDDMTLLVAARR